MKLTDRILLASLLVELSEGRQSFSFKETFAKNITPTLNLRMILFNQLILSQNLMVLDAKLHPLGLLTPKNSHRAHEVVLPEANTDALLAQTIAGTKDGLLATDEDEDGFRLWTSLTLVDHCVEFIQRFLPGEPLITYELKQIPEELVYLLSERPLEEVEMLLWRATKEIEGRESRLAKVCSGSTALLEAACNRAWNIHEIHKKLNQSAKKFRRISSFRESSIFYLLFRHCLGLRERNGLRSLDHFHAEAIRAYTRTG